MLAFTNDDVQTLNERAREIYKNEGRLGAEDAVQTEDGPQKFASGDRIYFLQNSRMLQVMNGTLGTVEKLERFVGKDEHRITVRLDKGDRLVEFSTAEYRDVMHGYAATIHKTQGATADRAMVLASPYMDRHATYVAMSRHIHEANLYYSERDFADFGKLEDRLGREARKDTTLDYAPAHIEAKPNHIPVPQAPTNEPRPANRMSDIVAMRRDPSRRDELRAYRAGRVEELRKILHNRTAEEDSSPGPSV
jgi:ATP-dependent exoDNAse (exonuclease V) alpha subunit